MPGPSEEESPERDAAAVLLEGWELYHSDDGTPYYFDRAANKSYWEAPPTAVPVPWAPPAGSLPERWEAHESKRHQALQPVPPGPEAASLAAQAEQGAWDQYRRGVAGVARHEEVLQPRRRRQFGESTFYLEGRDLVPVKQDFLFVSAAVKNRPRENDIKINLEYGIDMQARNKDQRLPKPVDAFEDCAFPDWMLECLRRWAKPTGIQVAAWPAALSGCDIVGIAETGSGKTLAYVLPMLVHVLNQPHLMPGEGFIGLIVVPTQELCQQVRDEVMNWAGNKVIECEAIRGGGRASESERQTQAMLGRVDVIVATPGRLIGMLKAKETNLGRATFFVLDEADEMLKDDFASQVGTLVTHMRPGRQVLLFSATWPKKVEDMAAMLCKIDPITIVVGEKLAACKNIEQDFQHIGSRAPGQAAREPAATKEAALVNIVEYTKRHLKKGERILVFVNKKDSVDTVVNVLRVGGFVASDVSGSVSQQERNTIIKEFKDARSEKVLMLVATDLMCRGHDFKSVQLVINYDMPAEITTCVHRIGRTGRASAPRVAR